MLRPKPTVHGAKDVAHGTPHMEPQVVNKSAALPLEFIVPPLGVFYSYKLMRKGSVIRQLDWLARAITTLNSTLTGD